MSYDPNDLGLDMERAKALPHCMACRKKTDGWKKCDDGTILCGTHYDEFKLHSPLRMSAAQWAQIQRETRYKACWEAKEEA